MPALPGVTGKTSRWAFLVSQEKYEVVADALRANHTVAAASPLHDSDVWDRPGILNYMKSWKMRRPSAFFLRDDDFQSVGLSYEDYLKIPELPYLVAWPVSSAADTDPERYSVSPDGDYCYTVLPCVGDTKKPHYHFQVDLAYPMPRRQFIALLGLPEDYMYYWEPVGKWDSLLRYYAHLDNPEKFQYDKEAIVSFGGFDKSPLYTKTEAQKNGDFEYVYTVIRSFPGMSLLQLTDRLIADGHIDIARKISAKPGFFKEILFQQSKDFYGDPDKAKPNYRKNGLVPGIDYDASQRETDEAVLSDLLSKVQ